MTPRTPRESGGFFCAYRQAETRPPLDLAVQKSELVRQFPLFSDMDDESLRQTVGNLLHGIGDRHPEL